MKKFKAVLFAGILTALCLCFLAGCSSYNAVLDSYANKLIDEEFLKNNLTYGIFYRNENFDPEKYDYRDPSTYRFIKDTMSPEDRTYIITEEQKFKEIFTKYDGTIDFENEMVVLFIFTDDNPGNYKLRDVILNGTHLNVKYDYEEWDLGDVGCVRSYQRCFMLKMEKIEFSDVEFVCVR